MSYVPAEQKRMENPNGPPSYHAAYPKSHNGVSVHGVLTSAGGRAELRVGQPRLADKKRFSYFHSPSVLVCYVSSEHDTQHLHHEIDASHFDADQLITGRRVDIARHFPAAIVLCHVYVQQGELAWTDATSSKTWAGHTFQGSRFVNYCTHYFVDFL